MYLVTLMTYLITPISKDYLKTKVISTSMMPPHKPKDFQLKDCRKTKGSPIKKKNRSSSALKKCL